MSTFDILTWALQEEELLSEGYDRGTPSTQCEHDCALVERETCERCGKALEFVPFVRWDAFSHRMRYRAFAVCRACDQASEF